MASVTHLRTQVHGLYKDATLAGEEWAFGVDLLPLLGALFQASAQDGAVRGVVRSDADGGAMPYVNMGWAGASIGTTTDAEGRYRLTLPPGTSTTIALEVRVTSSGLLPRTWSFKPVAGVITHDFALALTFSEEITVGSRAIGVEAEGAVPVDIITARQIEMTGASETMRAPCERPASSSATARATSCCSSCSRR